jgi:hypothetical protein
MVLEIKDLAGFINPSLLLPGNILNRVVLYRVIQVLPPARLTLLKL